MQFRNHNNGDQHTTSAASPEEKAKRITVQAGVHLVTRLILDSDAHRVIATFDDGAICVYSALTGTVLLTLSSHEGGVWASAFYKDTLVTGATDRTIRVWDLVTGVCTHVFSVHTSTVRTLQIVHPINVNQHNPEQTPKYEPEFPIIVAGSRDKTVSIWRLPVEELNGNLVATERENWLLHRMTGHTHSVRAVAGEGHLVASASYDCTARIWNSCTGELIHTLVGHEQPLYTVILDIEHRQCITSGIDTAIRIWSLDTGSSLHVLTGHMAMVGVMQLNAGLLVSADADGFIQVWDPATSERLRIIGHHPPGQGKSIMTIQHDGEKLVMGFEGAVQTWDIRTGELLHETKGVTHVWQVAFDRRRRVVAFNLPQEGSFSAHDQTYLEILDYGVAAEPQASSQ
ncbi:SCF ubiquitin ligase complex subunit cdc4 [Linnemannia exigua]|uniref:SCF ubiquitin ligase complex subunit cdc4 n=1 Tax=Linnemannia exigua TaxID=604196 RepID=A0AAD4HAT2_9FUNG|nr:SCF ubiquitin ligase complex subunit cdc4 [Linnemannia exigua]